MCAAASPRTGRGPPRAGMSGCGLGRPAVRVDGSGIGSSPSAAYRRVVVLANLPHRNQKFGWLLVRVQSEELYQEKRAWSMILLKIKPHEPP